MAGKWCPSTTSSTKAVGKGENKVPEIEVISNLNNKKPNKFPTSKCMK
jgi:hypothetical protein